MSWSPDTTEIEDGTGKSTAVVYEAPATGITWLNTRGKTSFSAASAALQEQYAVEAVEEAQDLLVELGFEAPPTIPTQALIFPSRGASRWDGRLYDTDEIPVHLLEAIRLIEEEKAAGTWMDAADLVGVVDIEEGGASESLSSTIDLSSLEANHPAIYRRLRRCMPA